MADSGVARTTQRPPTALRWAGWLTVGVSLLVVIGWLFGLPGLTSIVPGQIAMKFNTALVFLTFGAGAVLLGTSVTRNARRLGYGLFVAGAAASALTALQYVTGTDFGIDQLLVREPAGAIGTVHLGRMSPQTAVALIAVAAAAFLARLPRFAVPPTVLAAGGAFVFGAMNLLDFVYVAAVPTFLREYTQMAVPTAVLVTALSIAVVELLPSGGPISRVQTTTGSAVLLRPMLAAAVVVPVVVGWLRLEGERLGLYGSAFGVGIMTLTTISLFVLATSLIAGRMNRADERRALAEGRLEQALADANDLYENAPVGYHSLSADGVFVRMNATELGWLGYRREEVIGRKFSELLTPESVETFRQSFPVFLERGSVRDLEFELVRSDGSRMPVALSATAIRDADGNFVMSRSTVDDIGARRRAEQERERAKQEAEAANQAKSEFLSRMSHELRTPLNSVLGFAQLLEMDDLNTEQRENVQYIERAGRHLLDLINEVLDISRIESGTMTISMEAVSVSEVTDEVTALIAPLAAERGVTLHRLEIKDGEIHVLADHQRLRQVLLNLLSNAVKYNRPGGSIQIECSLIDPDGIRIDVRDTGRGISKEHLSRMFVAFDRLGAEHTEVEGTGMGLALSRRLVEAMGGSLGVRSTLGEGSTFSVELGRSQAPIAVLPAAAPPTTAEARSGPQRTVLYIEDNLANFRLVEQIVQRFPNVRLLSAMQGRLGIDLARQHRPDLILLDLHLPDMSGVEVLRELRSDAGVPGTKVVMLTADGTPRRARLLIEEGALAYLSKPLDVARFVEVLKSTLGLSEERRAS